MVQDMGEIRREAPFGEIRSQGQSAVERLRAQAELSHSIITRSQQTIARRVSMDPGVAGGDPDQLHGNRETAEEAREREVRARKRLQEWEAGDLTTFVPEEMDTTRRQFAVALYEMIRLASALSMSGERLHYHVDYALQRYLTDDG